MQLAAYAQEQGKLTDWDGTGRGYTWEYEYLSQWFWLFLIGDIFLSVFAISLAPQIYLAIKKIVDKRLQGPTSEKSEKKVEPTQFVSEQGNRPAEEAEEQDDDDNAPRITQLDAEQGNRQGEEGESQDGGVDTTSHEASKTDLVLSIFAFVLVVVCLLEFACSIYITVRASAICPNKSCLEEVVPTRIAILCFITVVAFVGSFVFGTVSGKLSAHKSFLEKFKHSAKEFFTITGFFSVFLLLAVNITPTIILGFIFPFEVITGIVYLPMIGIIVLLYTKVSSYIISEWENNIIHVKEKRKGDDKKALYFLYRLFIVFIVILFVSAATVIFVFSFAVHKAEVHPSLVSTLIPPVILFVLTTLAKKYVIDKYDPPLSVNINKCATALPVHTTDTLDLVSPTHSSDGRQALLLRTI